MPFKLNLPVSNLFIRRTFYFVARPFVQSMPGTAYDLGLRLHIFFSLSICVRQIKGCYEFSFTNKELGLQNLGRRYYRAVFNITAVMTEEATGVKRTATSTETKLVQHRVELSFNIGTPKHFKPGLPFYGKVRITDAR